MKKTLIPIIMAAVLFISCRKDEVKTSGSNNSIIGNWQVVDAANEPVTVEWGLFYVSTTKLYADNSFRINLGTGTDDNISKTGTYLLNENTKSIIFYSEVNDLGTIYRDTTEFNISFDAANRLILKNADITVEHVKLNN